MREQNDDIISDKSNIRIPIGILVGAVITLSLAFYAKIEADRLELKQHVADNKREIEQRLSDMSTRIGTKADKTDAGDRWTGRDQRAFEQKLEERHKSIDIRIESQTRENAIQHESLRMMIEHLSEDIDERENK